VSKGLCQNVSRSSSPASQGEVKGGKKKESGRIKKEEKKERRRKRGAYA